MLTSVLVLVLMDVTAGRQKRRCPDVAVADAPEIVVLDADGPIRRNTVLQTGADHAAPASAFGIGEARTSYRAIQAEILTADRSATLCVEEYVVRGVADLPGKQAEPVERRFERVGRILQADAGVANVGPVTLGFETEHPRAGLPAIAELTADQSTTGA